MNLEALVEADRVHKSVYTDAAIFDAEMEKIWERIWVYCGHESQVPASGVGSVLLHVTVTPRSGSGSLWVYAAGTARPTSPAMQFGGTTPLTATVLVPVSPTGAITFVTSGPGVSVAVDAIGYVTIG